jgi:DNA-binding SARP family transcriptional activator
LNIPPQHPTSSGVTTAPTDVGCLVRVFGSFGVEWRGEAVAPKAWRRVHARRLLKLLATAPRQIESRQRLQRLLWPDFDETRARNRLNHTVHWVRQALVGLPNDARPRILVRDEHLELRVPAPGGVDCAAFMQSLQADASSSEDRLSKLERALALYRADLAPDWQGCEEIDRRRRWLAKQHENALCETVKLALTLGHVEIALRRAHQLALTLEDDVDAHIQYAQLLSSAGRADAALLHLGDARTKVELDECEAASRIDTAMRAIQRQVNTSKPSPAACVTQMPRLALPAPPQQMLGYQSLLQLGLSHLASVDAAVLTLVGPPGCGKSLLAQHLACEVQARLAHGALKVDASWAARPADLLAAAQRAWAEATGCEAANEQELLQQWSERQMLVLLDGLAVTPALAEVVERWARTAGDVRWLVTAWTLLRIHGERSLKVDAQLLLAQPDEGDGPSPAALLLGTQSGISPSGDMLPKLERLAMLVEGLPIALEIVAEWLQMRPAAELEMLLTLSPSCLITARATPPVKRLRLTYAVQRWLLETSADTREKLMLLSNCRSALGWSDVATLLGEGSAPGPLTEAFVELAVRHHYLAHRARRASERGSASVSEFMVPRLVAAGLRQLAQTPLSEPQRAMLSAWIEHGPAGVPSSSALTRRSAQACATWFDDRADDIDLVRTWWCAKHPSERWLQWCGRNAAYWYLTCRPMRILAWLDDAIRDADAMQHACLPELLLLRGRLRERVGRKEGASRDAAWARRKQRGNPAGVHRGST